MTSGNWLSVCWVGASPRTGRHNCRRSRACLRRARTVCILFVTWPGSTVQPAAFGWKNTHVVQTLEATKLCLAADLVISAAGYNSVLEMLYHRIPAIFIPQSATLSGRSGKACNRPWQNRDLCAVITEKEFMKLERTVIDCLDHDGIAFYRSALDKFVLPQAGASKAAETSNRIGGGKWPVTCGSRY